ncbi:MAG TPA: hypothetical protein VMA75_04505 [Candidatus Paceibacterota bacterium]|nr:hypothetical protein [Candidatus Paceibacterota bacterium]
MDIKHILKDHAYQNVPLTFDEAYDLGRYTLKGCNGDPLAQIQSIAALSALHNKATYAWRWNDDQSALHGHALPRSAADQIAGICAAVFEHDIAVSPSGFLHPKVSYAMDNCGMGGDLVVTANVSTLAALIASAAGIPMCKHGSPANADKGRHGSSEFVASLGIDTRADRLSVEASVEEEGFGYTEALDINYKRIHSQTHALAKLPHMNDIIGPITNPLHPQLLSRRVLGVNHLVPPHVVAEVYQILNRRGITNLQHGMFVRGFVDSKRYEGMDEISICPGGTQVTELKNGEISEYFLTAEDFGLRSVSRAEITPPVGMSKGEFSKRILSGQISGPALQMVLANAAALFYLAGRSKNLRECYDMAKGIHLQGKDFEKAQSIAARVPILVS